MIRWFFYLQINIAKMTKKKTRELTCVPLNDKDNYFYSYDIGLAAYLLCLDGHELASMDKEVKNKVLFILTRCEITDEEVRNYWESKTSVDAQSYFNQLKRIKNEVHSY